MRWPAWAIDSSPGDRSPGFAVLKGVGALGRIPDRELSVGASTAGLGLRRLQVVLRGDEPRGVDLAEHPLDEGAFAGRQIIERRFHRIEPGRLALDDAQFAGS